MKRKILDNENKKELEIIDDTKTINDPNLDNNKKTEIELKEDETNIDGFGNEQLSQDRDFLSALMPNTPPSSQSSTSDDSVINTQPE